MKITRESYEAYFLDYLEGNLDENMVDNFLEFLKQNPDLKDELSVMENTPLEPESIFFNKKENLYKNKYDTETEFNQAAIALVEGYISASEKAEFDAYLLKHPEKKKEVQRFQQTKLRPDKTVVFAHKNKLYRRSLGKTIFLWSSRVAAVLVLALAVYFYIGQSGENIIDKNQSAMVENQEGGKTPAIAEAENIEPIKEIKTIPADLKNEIKPKATPTLHEPVQENTGYESIAEIRTPVETPPKLNSRPVALSVATNQPEVTLATMTITLPENYHVVKEERFLADAVKEKTRLDNFSFNKIKMAGLNLVSSISKDNFDYETNDEGKITELRYDSRLLAFSIPTNNEPVVGE
ncbi:MAG: hypothetical protein ACOCWD_04095 [Tangfeifania sp.]